MSTTATTATGRVRTRALQSSILAKQQQRPQVDGQGQPLTQPVPLTYDEHGLLIVNPAPTA